MKCESDSSISNAFELVEKLVAPKRVAFMYIVEQTENLSCIRIAVKLVDEHKIDFKLDDTGRISKRLCTTKKLPTNIKISIYDLGNSNEFMTNWHNQSIDKKWSQETEGANQIRQDNDGLEPKRKKKIFLSQTETINQKDLSLDTSCFKERFHIERGKEHFALASIIYKDRTTKKTK